MRRRLATCPKKGVRSTSALNCCNGSMSPMSSPFARFAHLRIYNDNFGSGYCPQTVDEPEIFLLIWGEMSKQWTYVRKQSSKKGDLVC